MNVSKRNIIAIIFRIWVGSRRRKRRSEILYRLSDKWTNYLIRNHLHILSHSTNVIAITRHIDKFLFLSWRFYHSDLKLQRVLMETGNSVINWSCCLFHSDRSQSERNKEGYCDTSKADIQFTFHISLFSALFLLSFHLFSTMSGGRSGGSLMGGTDDPSVSIKVLYLYRIHLKVILFLGGILLHGGS